MREAAARLALVTRPEEVTREIARVLTRTVETDSVAVALPVTASEVEVLLVDGTETEHEPRRLPIDAHHPLVETARDGRPRLFGDVDELLAEYPELEERARASGDRAWAHVALQHEGSVVGAIGLGFGQPRRFTERDARFYQEFAHISLAAIERARLYAAEAAARRQAENAAARSNALVAAAIAANQATSPREVLAAVARSVEGITGGEVALAAFWREGDPEPAEVISKGFPTAEQVRWVRGRLRRASTPVVIGAGTTPRPSGWLPDRLVVLVPILWSGQRIGALAVLYERPELHGDEIALLAALASLASQAFERSRLHERERQTAATLQQSLLTFDFPATPGVECTARYRSSVDQLEVGGDWFQLVPLAGASVALAVGDVVGRGLLAASAMGQLRSALAGAALSQPSPIQVLRTLDRMAVLVAGGLYTTVAYCLLDREKMSLRYARAGHPPPLLIRRGEARYLSHGLGPPLAADPQMRDGEGRVELLAGDQVVLYTDGLVERRSEPIDRSLARLREEAGNLGRLGIEEAADRLLERMLDPAESTPDDVTLLWVAVA